MLWLFVTKAPLAEGYSEALLRDRQVKRKVFKLRRDADDIPSSITLRSAGGVSFQSAGSTTANARFWDREVYGIKVQEDHSDQQSAADERSEQIFV